MNLHKRRLNGQGFGENEAEGGTDSEVELENLPDTEVQSQADEDEKTKWYPLSHLDDDKLFKKSTKAEQQEEASKLVEKLSTDNADYFCGK